MFDVSAIPTDATITAVSLALAMNNGTPLATTHTLHRVTAAWGEAGSDAGTPGGLGAPAQTGDATWTFRLYDTDAWTTPGGDYETDASATTSIGGAGSYEISSQGMIDDVQAWVTGTVVNDGWIFLGDESSVQTAKRFASKENPTASARPALTVTYTTASPTKTRSWSAIKSRYVR